MSSSRNSDDNFVSNYPHATHKDDDNENKLITLGDLYRIPVFRPGRSIDPVITCVACVEDDNLVNYYRHATHYNGEIMKTSDLH